MILAKKQKESYKGLPQRYALYGGWAVYSAEELTPQQQSYFLNLNIRLRKYNKTLLTLTKGEE